MSDRENKSDDDEIFSMVLADEQTSNQRKATRYIRDDITISIRKSSLLNLSKRIPVILLDISSKGAAVECEKRLKIKNKVILEMIFQDEHQFIIPAKIVHQIKDKNRYGLKFDKVNDGLGDYILSSQNDLIFK